MLTMKRTIATLLSFSAVAFASKPLCPCFNGKQLEAIMEKHDFGCHFTTSSDKEVQSMAMAYLYAGSEPVGTMQAGVTTEYIGQDLVDGGFCGVGAKEKMEVKKEDVKDYADGVVAPEEFQACFEIMKEKCTAKCSELKSLPEGRSGCGKLPF